MNEQERNRATMRRIYADLASGHDLSLVDELYTEDTVDHEDFGGGNGRDGIRALFRGIYSAFPDFRMDVEDTVAEGDKVCARVTSSGTHAGDFMGIPATGRQISFSSVDVMRFEDGQVAEHWGISDLHGLLAQIDARESLTS